MVLHQSTAMFLLTALAVLPSCLGFSLTTTAPSLRISAAVPFRQRRHHTFLAPGVLRASANGEEKDGAHHEDAQATSTKSKSVVVSGQAAIDELPPERRQSLYEHLLRDLEIEGVPLLECDVDQAFTMQAAMWLTLAQLVEAEDMTRACLVLGRMPMEALLTLVEDTNDLLKQAPTLAHMHLSLVGRGVGPGLILSVNSTLATPGEYENDVLVCQDPESVDAAVNSFLRRMGPSVALPTGPESNFVKVANSAEICETLATVWNFICELLLTQPPAINSGGAVVLALPIGKLPPEAFETLTGVMDATLKATRATDVIDVSYFHKHSPVPLIVVRQRGMEDAPVSQDEATLQASLQKEIEMLR